jgi:hypothetical protein
VLHELQQQWMQSLLDPNRASADLSHGLNGGVRSSDMAFAVYVNNVRANVLNALLQSYPATAALVGERVLRVAILELLKTHPPISGDLGVYGESLSDVIGSYVDKDRRLLIEEMARYEWALDQLRRCSREPAWTLQEATTLPNDKWAGLKLTLTRQSQMFISNVSVKANHAALLAGQPLMPDVCERLLLIAGDNDVSVAEFDQVEWSWLCALSAGDLEHATNLALKIDRQFNLQSLLKKLLAAGALAPPEQLIENK